MKRIILLVALIVYGLVWTPTATARRSLPATDSFTDRTAATLGSNWTATNGAITDWVVNVGTGTSTGYGGSDFIVDYWNADSFTADQSSHAQINKGLNGYEGVGVHITSGFNGCVATLDGNIYKWVSGTRSTIGTFTNTWSSGDTLKVDIVGSTLTVYRNGSSVGTTAGCSLSSGSPGIVGYSDGTFLIFSWQGDNVGSSAPSALPAIFGPRGGLHGR